MYFLFLVALTIIGSVHCAHVNSVDTNVVGGEEVTIEDFKYQVALIKADQLWCGGSIITDKHIITAGHCVLEIIHQLYIVTIRAGSTFWNKGGSLHNAKSGVVYVPDFASEKLTYKLEDLGIITVVQPFEFDDTRQPIPLATGDTSEPDGALAIVSGWGSIHGGNLTDQLGADEVPLVNPSTCSAIWGGGSLGGTSGGEVCAGGKKSVCNGDYGGPLVLNGVLVGVATYSLGCADPNYPGIFSYIAYYNKWIKEQLARK